MKNNYLFLTLISALSFGQISQVKDINPTTASSTPTTFFNYNGSLLFRATDGVKGIELWKSDGTEAGTVLVKDINAVVSATSNSNPQNFTVFNNKVYFNATTGTTVSGQELWTTDGTDAGTTLVRDIRTGTASSNPQDFTVINPTTMLFSANDGTNGVELWKTDGTEVGTVNVVDYSGTANSVTWMENLNGTAIIGQIVTATGRELYKSDGTSANSGLILDVNPGSSLGVGTGFFKNGNTIYFQGNDGTTGLELWKTDGTTAGTVLVKDINPGITASGISDFAAVGNDIYFKANGPNGEELWKSDGTAAGTVEVADINIGTGNSNPDQLASINGVIYFFAADNDINYDLYKYASNTLTKLKDFNAIGSTVLTAFEESNGIIYFAADSDADGLRELWQTDGTASGTVLVSSLISGSINPKGVSNLTKIGTSLFFGATDTAGQELFSYKLPTLSVDDQNLLQSVTIYPNPSNGNFFIDNATNETVQYEVFDVLGKKLDAGQTNGNAININANAGVYILKLKNKEKVTTTKIIIK
jgi:ELWxxDGT repeat protein